MLFNIYSIFGNIITDDYWNYYLISLYDKSEHRQPVFFYKEWIKKLIFCTPRVDVLTPPNHQDRIQIFCGQEYKSNAPYGAGIQEHRNTFIVSDCINI